MIHKTSKISSPPPSKIKWIPLSTSVSFLLRKKKLLGMSIFLFFITGIITWLTYLVTVGFVDNLTGDFLVDAPATGTLWGWVKHKGWIVSKWLFLAITRIVAFYLAFLTAYCLTSPGYVILSTATEKLQAGKYFQMDEALSLKGIFTDLLEGLKIGGFGVIVTIIAFLVNFIPGIGQITVFLLYTYYSALMFVDYPSSRRRWSLGQKISWLGTHKTWAFRLGVLPAIVSMIPLLNIFFMAMLFPLLTVHTTLNFTALTQEKTEHI